MHYYPSHELHNNLCPRYPPDPKWYILFEVWEIQYLSTYFWIVRIEYKVLKIDILHDILIHFVVMMGQVPGTCKQICYRRWLPVNVRMVYAQHIHTMPGDIIVNSETHHTDVFDAKSMTPLWMPPLYQYCDIISQVCP
jgi:hypothetical protein